MKIDILTLFPHMFDGVFEESIIKRALDDKKVEIKYERWKDSCPSGYRRTFNGRR